MKLKTISTIFKGFALSLLLYAGYLAIADGNIDQYDALVLMLICAGLANVFGKWND
jgi:hypothetical protein